MEQGYRVGVDIGGTFTDLVLLAPDGRRFTHKTPSTVEDYSRAITEGLSALLASEDVPAAALAELLHGTTVASNAILELRGARTGLITTKGFRDVLEIRTLRMPRLYDLTWTKPPPLVERYLRTEVDERVNAQGAVERPLDEDDVRRAVRLLLDEQVEAIAVCLLHSYLNPVHELAIKRIVEEMAPGITLCISAEVLPEIKEYERSSTTVINAYVRPIVARYLAALAGELARVGVRAPVLLMQSNGGLITAQAASVLPMHIIESGPAAGVVGAQALARQAGLERVISFDMGGTTAKASLIEHGEFVRAAEYSVGAGIMIGSRLLTGAGYVLKVPAIDLAEVGAGGGSIIWTDAGGALQIGPHSAGAAPGPACYGAGGTAPTITDANVVLGLLNPNELAGGTVRLFPEKAQAALAPVATALGMTVEDAAHGAHRIAASNMMRAIKAVSSERARDPRDYALVGFGGNGPLFAASMAQALGMTRVVIPPAAGVFSSFGLLASDVAYHLTRTRRALLRVLEPDEVAALFGGLADDATARLAADGFGPERIHLTRSAALHYQGQSFELSVPLPEGDITPATLAYLEEEYGRLHERTYGHRAGADEPVELVTALVVGTGIPDRPRLPPPPPEAPSRRGRDGRRRAYFGPGEGWRDAVICDRGDLAGGLAGPAIVEEYDSTCVVPPGCHATLDRLGNIVIEIGAAAGAQEPAC